MTETATEWRWPFQLGDKVTCRGNWGPLVTDLRIHSQQNPGAVYEVCAAWAGGRWISLKDEQGRVYGAEPGGYGHTYFRVAGDCGGHVPGHRDGGWLCLRCDDPTPAPGGAGTKE